MKMANTAPSDSLSIPAPHGFPRQPPKSCTSNQNLVCKEDDPLTLSSSHEHNQRPNDFPEEQPPRGTSRKRSLPETSSPPPGQRRRGRPPKSETRSLPQSDVPTSVRPPVQGQCRRGPPPKASNQPRPKTSSLPQTYVSTTAQPPVQGQRRRGRQPKAGYQPRPKTSSLPQSYVPTTAQPPVQGQRRRGRKPKAGCQPMVPVTKSDISVDEIRPKVVQSSSFHAGDIEETHTDASLAVADVPVSYEKTQILSHNHQISEAIDTKLLQYVANAQQNMSGTQTVLNDAEVISRTPNVNKEIVRTLKAINEKHGDIAQNCSLESDYMKTLVLFGICKVVQDLQKKQLKDLDICSLGSYYTIVTDAENMKVNVQWLHNRLNEIRDALHLSDEAKTFINEKEGRVGNIDRKKKELEMLKSELETLKSEIQDTEEELAREVVMVEELNKKFDDQMSKISQFKHENLMDGII